MIPTAPARPKPIAAVAMEAPAEEDCVAEADAPAALPELAEVPAAADDEDAEPEAAEPVLATPTTVPEPVPEAVEFTDLMED